MSIEIRLGDLFSPGANAIVLPIDGSQPGLEGSLASSFLQKFPNDWEAVSSEIQYPMALGAADVFKTDSPACCTHYVVIVSTLHHMQQLDSDNALTVVQNATRSAIEMGMIYKIERLDFPVLSGGWRLTSAKATISMLNTYLRMSMGQTLIDVRIVINETKVWDDVLENVASMGYFQLEHSNQSVRISRR